MGADNRSQEGTSFLGASTGTNGIRAPEPQRHGEFRIVRVGQRGRERSASGPPSLLLKWKELWIRHRELGVF
jgi:hypothetical protein